MYANSATEANSGHVYTTPPSHPAKTGMETVQERCWCGVPVAQRDPCEKSEFEDNCSTKVSPTEKGSGESTGAKSEFEDNCSKVSSTKKGNEESLENEPGERYRYTNEAMKRDNLMVKQKTKLMSYKCSDSSSNIIPYKPFFNKDDNLISDLDNSYSKSHKERKVGLRDYVTDPGKFLSLFSL